MAVISTVGKAFFIFFSFMLVGIIMALYVNPLFKYGIYILVNETTYEMWGGVYPQSLSYINSYLTFYFRLLDAFPYFLILFGSFLAGWYLYKNWVILRYTS